MSRSRLLLVAFCFVEVLVTSGCGTSPPTNAPPVNQAAAPGGTTNLGSAAVQATPGAGPTATASAPPAIAPPTIGPISTGPITLGPSPSAAPTTAASTTPPAATGSSVPTPTVGSPTVAGQTVTPPAANSVVSTTPATQV